MVVHNRIENQISKGKLTELMARANEYIIQELPDNRVESKLRNHFAIELEINSIEIL